MIKDFCRYTKRFFKNKTFKIILYILIGFILLLINKKVVNASSIGATDVDWKINFDKCQNVNGSVNCVPSATREANFNMSSNRYSNSQISSFADNIMYGFFNMGDYQALRSMEFTFNNLNYTAGSSGTKQIHFQIPFITNNTDYITGSSNVTDSKNNFPGLPFYSFRYNDIMTWSKGTALHMKPYSIQVYQKGPNDTDFSWVDYTQYNLATWHSTTYQYGVALTIPNSYQVTRVKIKVGSPTHFKGSYSDFENKFPAGDYSKLNSSGSIYTNTISDYIAYCGNTNCRFIPTYQQVFIDKNPSSIITERMVYLVTEEELNQSIKDNESLENINYQNGQLLGDILTSEQLNEIFEDSKDYIDSSTEEYVTDLSDLFSYIIDAFNSVVSQDLYVNGEVNYSVCQSTSSGGAHNNRELPLYRNPNNHNQIWSVELPCMTEIYKNLNEEYQQYHILDILRLIIHFIFVWWFANNLISLIKFSIDPTDTEIEVLDL